MRYINLRLTYLLTKTSIDTFYNSRCVTALWYYGLSGSHNAW